MATPRVVWSHKIFNVRLAWHENGAYSLARRKPDPVTGVRPTHWYSHWRRLGPCQKCEGRKFCPEHCDAEAYAGALQVAAAIAGGIQTGSGSPCGQAGRASSPDRLTVRAAFEYYLPLKLEGAGHDHSSLYSYNSFLFVRWLEAHRPEIRDFDQLTYDILQEYANAGMRGWPHKKKRELSPVTQAARFDPIKMVWNAYSVRPGCTLGPFNRYCLRLPRISAGHVGRTARARVWSAEELVTLLKLYRSVAADIFPAAAFLAFTGSRMREACYLRLCDVDISRKIVTITSTPWHKRIKTPSSQRQLPITETLAGILAERMEQRKKDGAGPEDPLFVSDLTGKPYAVGYISHKFTKAKLRAAEVYRQVQIEEGVAEKDLVDLGRCMNRKSRASFTTLARRAGVPVDRLAAYLGHADGSAILQAELAHQRTSRMLQRHYLEVTPLDLLKEVVDPVSRVLAELWNRPEIGYEVKLARRGPTFKASLAFSRGSQASPASPSSAHQPEVEQ